MMSAIPRSFLFGLAWVIALQVCGCGVTGNLGPATTAEQQALVTAATGPQRLQAGEKIRVNVFGEDKLSGEYEIDPSGFVSLPLAGTIKAAGSTQSEFEQELAKKFRSEYLRNPKVTVSIASFRPFYIVGEVEKPGEYPYKGGLNILTALAIAGGPTYRASKSTVLIQHPGENGLREYPMSSSVPVLPGDLIRIPERYF
jgi:polysaccharide export outer membrane protein